jgi:hypothetical protein
LLKQKVAQKVTIILGYFILSKNHNEPPKVAQFAKKLPNLVTLAVTKKISLCKIDTWLTGLQLTPLCLRLSLWLELLTIVISLAWLL